jgi:hypothetical protein
MRTKHTNLLNGACVAAVLLPLAGVSAPAFAKAGGPSAAYFDQLQRATSPEYIQAQKWSLCARRYPTFNARTGTFVGEDGLTHRCQ